MVGGGRVTRTDQRLHAAHHLRPRSPRPGARETCGGGSVMGGGRSVTGAGSTTGAGWGAATSGDAGGPGLGPAAQCCCGPARARMQHT